MLKLWILLGALVISFSSGCIITYKWIRGNEIKALNETIRTMNESILSNEIKSAKIVGTYSVEVAELNRKINVLEREVRNAIPDIRECDYSVAAVRVLNTARGYPLPESTTESPSTAWTTPAITQRDAANFWINDIAEYNACVLQLNALIDWYRN